ncbi:MAG: M56 family metallopeptidase [Bacteroidota bacterium]|nr:M56 family metallopeptidase [Bacteroidota bacterium]
MSLSLVITNFFFCSLAILFMLPAFRQVKILTYKKGLPLFIGLMIIIFKVLLPIEFHFTQTIASGKILPIIHLISKFNIYGISLVNALMMLWAFSSFLLLIRLYNNHKSSVSIFSAIKMTKNENTLTILYKKCIEKGIKKTPKVIQFDIKSSPFIIGYFNPTIVLPEGLNKEELNYALSHELEHYKNHHLEIKLILEVLTTIFWWYPIIWILKKRILHSLELQVDSYLTSDFNEKEKINYAEIILDIAKRRCVMPKSALAFSFVNNSIDDMQNRISEIVDAGNITINKRISKLSILTMILSIIFFVYPLFYTYEAYYYNPENTEGTFIVNNNDTYLIQNNNSFDIYINGKYSLTVKEIPQKFSHFPIYEQMNNTN